MRASLVHSPLSSPVDLPQLLHRMSLPGKMAHPCDKFASQLAPVLYMTKHGEHKSVGMFVWSRHGTMPNPFLPGLYQEIPLLWFSLAAWAAPVVDQTRVCAACDHTFWCHCTCCLPTVLHFWWMFANRVEDPTKIHDAQTIQLECLAR